jgi:hypothetical protein
MDALVDQLMSDHSDFSQALGGAIDRIEDDSSKLDPSEPLLVLERVSICLDSALRSFAEGDPERACRYLAEANFIFEYQAEVKPKPGSLQQSTSSRPTEQDETPLLRAAIA